MMSRRTMFQSRAVMTVLLIICILFLFSIPALAEGTDNKSEEYDFEYYTVPKEVQLIPSEIMEEYYQMESEQRDAQKIADEEIVQNSSNKLFSPPITKSAPIESSYDLRKYGLVSGIRSQNPFSTCWVHAGIASIESSVIRQGYETADSVDLSEFQAVYFLFNREEVTQNPSDYMKKKFAGIIGDHVEMNDKTRSYLDTDGNIIYLYAHLATGLGIAHESSASYSEIVKNPNTKLPSNLAVDENVYLLSDVSQEYTTNQNAVKELIKKRGVGTLSFSLKSSDIFPIGESTRKTVFYRNDLSNTEGHIVAIVGWDDSFPATDFKNTVGGIPPGNGAWLIKNSWGTGWGDEGFFWLSYYDASIINGALVSFFDVVPYSSVDTIYQYDGGVLVGYYSGSACNKYIAQGNQEITKISFVAGVSNKPYTIKVVNENTGSTSQISGTVAYAGYHTIELPSPVKVSDKQTFAVYLTMDFIGCDTYGTSSSNGFTTIPSTEGEQCFIVKNDGTLQKDGRTFRIKAFAENIDAPSSLTISGSDSVSIGKSIQLSAQCYPTTASSKVTWSSSNTAVATIDESGKVTGKSSGSTTITASSKANPSISASKTITVGSYVTRILLTSDDWFNLLGTDIIFNGNLRLKANCYPENSLQSVIWKSSDPSIATVDATGWVHPVSEGTVTITATAKDGSGVYAEQKVELSKVLFLFWLFVKGEQKSMSVGDTDYLIHPLDKMDMMNMKTTSSVLPPNAKSTANESNATDVNISSISAITRTVSTSSGLKSIDAEDNSIAVTKATINSYLSLKQQKNSNAENSSNESNPGTPLFTANSGTIWTSNNANVVTVDRFTGKVTAVGPGYATVTGIVDGVTYTVEYHVVGSGTVTSITLSGPSSVLVGDTITLRANVLPSYATYKTVKWTSSSNAVQLTPSSDTLSCTVKGVKADSSVLITATSNDIASGQKAETFIEVCKPSVTPTPIPTVIPTPKPTPIPSTEPGTFSLHRSPWDDTYAEVGTEVTIYATLPQYPQYTNYEWFYDYEYSYFEDDNSDPVGSFNQYYDVDTRQVRASFIPSFVGKASFRLKFTNTNTGEYAISSPYKMEFIRHYDFTIDGPETVNVGDTVWYTAHPKPITEYDAFKWKVTSGSDKITEYEGFGCNPTTYEPIVKFKATNPGSVTISISPVHGYTGDSASKTIKIVRPVTSISISGNNSVALGNTVTLTASISPNDATNKEVSWSISSGSGTIISTTNADASGKSTCTVRPDKAGPITVSAKAKDASGITAMHQIAVSQPVTNIILTGNDTVEVGDTISLSVTLEPADATDKTVLFSYDNTTVLSVDENGVVTGLAGGVANVTVTAKSGNISKTKMIRVIVPVSSVSISGYDTVSVGKTIQLTATVLPKDATNKTIKWSSDNTAIATIDEATGIVTGMKEGTCMITASAGGKSQTKQITVVKDIESVTITGNNTVIVGKTTKLTAIVSPSDAPNKAVTWTSSNTAVATVDTTGLVTGVSAGTCIITATVDGRSQMKAISVISFDNGEEAVIDVNHVPVYIYEGYYYDIGAKLLYENGTVIDDINVVWKSTNDGVASVTGDNKLRAISPGVATIIGTYTMDDGTKISGSSQDFVVIKKGVLNLISANVDVYDSDGNKLTPIIPTDEKFNAITPVKINYVYGGKVDDPISVKSPKIGYHAARLPMSSIDKITTYYVDEYGQRTLAGSNKIVFET